jgi:hypothetical protein
VEEVILRRKLPGSRNTTKDTATVGYDDISIVLYAEM